MNGNNEQKTIDALLDFALAAGATRVKCLSPEDVVVEEKLAEFCREPKCPHFGQAMSCPPHVSGPTEFRKLLRSSKMVLVIRLEIESASLHGNDRPEVMRLLQEITAAVEIEAKRLGFVDSAGFAGGSCKPSFCAEHQNCRVIAEKKPCRFPNQARPSMSGYGVNVGALMKSAGWSTDLFAPPGKDLEESLAWVAGLVLLR